MPAESIMGKLFGTDGIRGVANQTLTCDLAYRVGQAAAICLSKAKDKKPTVVIGMDTRISSDMLEHALLAGLCACGCNAIRLGVIATPAVAYLTVHHQADAGIVISASHNPYEHNGIKMFSSEGFKLSDALEAEIEELILSEEPLPVKTRWLGSNHRWPSLCGSISESFGFHGGGNFWVADFGGLRQRFRFCHGKDAVLPFPHYCRHHQ